MRFGLVIKSTAPAASPSNVAFAPFEVCADTSTTGSWCLSTIRLSVLMPSRRGISRSNVITFGTLFEPLDLVEGKHSVHRGGNDLDVLVRFENLRKQPPHERPNRRR